MKAALLNCSAFGALSLALSTGIASADPAPQTDIVRTGLGQPGYIVQKGEWLSMTSYSHQTSSGESVKATGDLNAKGSGYADTGGQTFTYGLTDHLSINLRQSYESTHSEADRVDGLTTDAHSQRLADPAFGVTWRALDQRPHPCEVGDDDADRNHRPRRRPGLAVRRRHPAGRTEHLLRVDRRNLSRVAGDPDPVRPL